MVYQQQQAQYQEELQEWRKGSREYQDQQKQQPTNNVIENLPNPYLLSSLLLSEADAFLAALEDEMNGVKFG